MNKEEVKELISTKDILQATSEELKEIHMRLAKLESKLNRYDRIFESAFREEAESRLHLGSLHGHEQADKAYRASSLEMLRMKLERKVMPGTLIPVNK